MGKMKLSIFFVLCAFHLLLICTEGEGQGACHELIQESGEITDSAVSTGTGAEKKFSRHEQCWKIVVPVDNGVRIDIVKATFNNLPCADVYLKIGDEKELCLTDTQNTTKFYSGEITIAYLHNSETASSSFTLKYQIERRISTIRGLAEKRTEAISWLVKERLPSFGWDNNTPRAITALILAGHFTFQKDSLEEQLMLKELERQISNALLRQSSEPLTVVQLSMFINALRVACFNPRDFLGYDFVQMLSDRRSNSPAAYLALCSADGTITEANVRSLLKSLENLAKKPALPMYLDTKAMTIMALSCLRNKSNVFITDTNAATILNTGIKNLMESQLADGSFGNLPSTTAAITQALLASGQESSKEWNVTSAVQFLMKQEYDMSFDTLVLPIFNGKSQADVANIAHCPNQRDQDPAEKEIFDIMNKAGTKKQVQYDLYVGDDKDLIHVINLRIPDSNTVFDLMKVAKNSDPKFNFDYTDVSGQKYVYKLGGISNDPGEEKYWQLYVGWTTRKNRIALRSESPDKVSLKDGDYFVMWYKTAQI